MSPNKDSKGILVSPSQGKDGREELELSRLQRKLLAKAVASRADRVVAHSRSKAKGRERVMEAFKRRQAEDPRADKPDFGLPWAAASDNPHADGQHADADMKSAGTQSGTKAAAGVPPEPKQQAGVAQGHHPVVGHVGSHPTAGNASHAGATHTHQTVGGHGPGVSHTGAMAGARGSAVAPVATAPPPLPAMGKGPAEDKVEVSAPPEASMPYDKQGGETKAEAMANGGAVTPQMTMLTASEPVRPPPQKAVVKPNVLTHVIEGYIIQEGPEPFPVSRSSLIAETESPKPSAETNGKVENEELQQVAQVPPEAEASPQGTAEHERVELAKCEMCAKLGTKSKFKKSKRFCSSSCVKRYNLACSERLGIFAFSSEPENEDELPGKITKKKKMGRKSWRKVQVTNLPAYSADKWPPAREADLPSFPGAEQPLHKPESSVESPAAAPTEMEVDASPAALPSKSPRIWTVQEVADYIQELPGCTDYAEEFRSQEIDGQALLLLKEDHLMTAMNIKLGPALKICAKINSLREEQ
ncbi:hypothetical protein HPB47_026194 [Ixodes persulcatus]|uniref:Uncharacterized protein n=1 Tax=Ixodes persulcatus TaxID=34615 RepID=A0AC60PZF4_IXOPE|nr:hypothetical protein HPB47_026194 [Ixodes persulcatus]